MGEVLNLKQREPIYCGQDLREFIGFRIADILSDEIDCNVSIVLKNDKTHEKVTVAVADGVFDGETLFAMHR